MYVYCNFYCSPAKKHGSDPPTFLGLATPLNVVKLADADSILAWYVVSF